MWDRLGEVAGSPFGGSRVSSVPQRALCPKRCEPQLRPFLFKCNPGTRSHQSSSAVRDLGSTVDPLNGTFLGQEPREAPVTTDTGAPGWGAIWTWQSHKRPHSYSHKTNSTMWSASYTGKHANLVLRPLSLAKSHRTGDNLGQLTLSWLCPELYSGFEPRAIHV